MDIIKFIAKKLEAIEIRPGCWSYSKVGVFQQELDSNEVVVSEHQVGEFIRNYGFNPSTFCPFKRGDKWYALYSKHYMYTRVMSLPDCIDMGGEDESNVKFIPELIDVILYKRKEVKYREANFIKNLIFKIKTKVFNGSIR